MRGVNTGKIVVVVRRYFGEDVNDARWPRALFPWVVTSLGSPLRSVCIDTGKEAPPSMNIVVDDCDLEPLRDEDDATGEQTSHPRSRKAMTTGPARPSCVTPQKKVADAKS